VSTIVACAVFFADSLQRPVSIDAFVFVAVDAVKKCCHSMFRVFIHSP
jgi:hypothetical protein